MTPQAANLNRPLFALLPPEDGVLSYYVKIEDVLRRVPISHPKLLEMAQDLADPCPPAFQLSKRLIVMDAAAVEAWIRGCVVGQAS